MQKNKLARLASERSQPCVTISMNTHRTHPDNATDNLVFKNLLEEAWNRVTFEYGKRSVSELLEKISDMNEEIDMNYNLDSVHVFLSNSTKEIIKSPWPTRRNTVQIADNFAIKPLIKIFNRTEDYMILLLSKSGSKLFHAENDAIAEEIKNDEFPFTENPHYLGDAAKLSDAKKVNNMVREYLNKVDKAVVKIYNETEMNCVVVCTEDNFSRLMQVSHHSSVYHGYTPINYNDTADHTIADSAWKTVRALQKKRRADNIKEMQDAISQGNVITSLPDIFRAVKEGRGELLITHDDFHQAVKMTGPFSFDMVKDVTQPGVVNDITSEIAWEVISKRGRALFTSQEEIKTLGDIALKVRY